eukprot:gb/GEZN01003716.1/.p1 GENE.gb/GEZN01003716.1/~~gb/GEZN01003716.1/.p1  ORF type:complete len:569 (+),score=49.06 gb/GEZN01003716.1/:84-1790(+)
MSAFDYVQLEGGPGRFQPARVVGRLTTLLLVGLSGLAGFATHLFSAQDSELGSNAAGLPHDGVGATSHTSKSKDKVETPQPGPPYAQSLIPLRNQTISGPSSLFVYPGLLPENAKFMTGAMDRNGWIFGARLFWVNASGTSLRNSIAVPTGRSDDILIGRILSWPPAMFKEKMLIADKMVGYDPKNKSNEVFMRRSVISVFRKDGSKMKAYWYFQGAVEEVTRKRATAERERIVAEELQRVEKSERKFGVKRRIGVTSRKPILLITYGPPGSGKSTVVKSFLSHESLPPQEAWIDCNIDRLISSYDKAVPVLQQLTLDQCQRCHVGNEHELDSDLGDECHPAIEKWLHARANEVYLEAYPRLSRVNDQLIETGFELRKNILFETTASRQAGLVGLGGLLWATSAAKKHGYKVVLIYPVVNADYLYKRIKTRACDTGQTPIPEEVSQRSVMNAFSNFHDILMPSANILVDEIVVWNNNKPPPSEGPLPMLIHPTKGMPCKALTTTAASAVADTQGWNLTEWTITLNELQRKQYGHVDSEGTREGQTRWNEIIDFIADASTWVSSSAFKW